MIVIETEWGQKSSIPYDYKGLENHYYDVIAANAVAWRWQCYNDCTRDRIPKKIFRDLPSFLLVPIERRSRLSSVVAPAMCLLLSLLRNGHGATDAGAANASARECDGATTPKRVRSTTTADGSATRALIGNGVTMIGECLVVRPPTARWGCSAVPWRPDIGYSRLGLPIMWYCYSMVADGRGNVQEKAQRPCVNCLVWFFCGPCVTCEAKEYRVLCIFVLVQRQTVNRGAVPGTKKIGYQRKFLPWYQHYARMPFARLGMIDTLVTHSDIHEEPNLSGFF
eukprot:SAG31_NODE_3268_length_4478_cov_2.701987_1_plen_281_part_00